LQSFNYWADGIRLKNSRNILSFENQSTYNYVSELQLFLRNTPKYYYTKFATCYTEGCQSNTAEAINVSSVVEERLSNIDYESEDEKELEENYRVLYEVKEQSTISSELMDR